MTSGQDERDRFVADAVGSTLAITRADQDRSTGQHDHRQVRDRKARLRIELGAALWNLHFMSGLSTAHIIQSVTMALTDAGLSPGDAAGLAPTETTIRNVVGTHHAPRSRPVLADSDVSHQPAQSKYGLKPWGGWRS